ncbi:hypothetical protein [[Pseudomonas] boreopolis]|uniref:hypothetical protein n=1 Tax=Xanthomonas boreopolis TaxID=86183 RepID=UPI003DA117B9
MKRLLPALLLLLAACAAPASQSQATAPAAAPAKIDTTCRTDADCTVKNVGNCCGAYPACVNAASPTDPEGVMAQCRASGRMSVCGFREISGCQCVSGQCTAKDGGADTLRRPPDTPEPVR